MVQDIDHEKVLKAAKAIWDSFGRFRNTRKAWREIIDETYKIDIGKHYADFGDREYDHTPAWALKQYVSRLEGTPTKYTARSRTGKATDAAQDVEAFLNKLDKMTDQEADPLTIGHIAGDGVGVQRMEIVHTWKGMPKLAGYDVPSKAKEAKREFKLSVDPPFDRTWVDPLACAWRVDNKGVARLFVHQGE